MRHAYRFFQGLLLVSMITAGCGGEQAQPAMSSKSAAVVQGATTNAITAMQQKLVGQLGDFADGAASDWLAGTAGDFKLDGKLVNDLGGDLGISGTGATTTAGAYSVDTNVTFTGWKDQSGVVLDGSVAVKVGVTQLVPPKISISVKGTLTASGIAAGQAAIDMTFNLDGANVDICGAIAGYTIPTGACTGAGEPPANGTAPPTTGIGANSAKLVQAAVYEALSQLQGPMLAELSMLATGQNIPFGKLLKGSASGFDVGSTFSGALGGSMVISGKGAEADAGYTAKLQALLKKYRAASGNLTLDGKLTVDYDIASVSPVDLTVTVKGDLDVSGAQAGSANVDLTIVVTDTDTEICGQVAGHQMGICD